MSVTLTLRKPEWTSATDLFSILRTACDNVITVYTMGELRLSRVSHRITYPVDYQSRHWSYPHNDDLITRFLNLINEDGQCEVFGGLIVLGDCLYMFLVR